MADTTKPTPEDTMAAIKAAQAAGFVFLVKTDPPRVRRSGYRALRAASGKPLRKASKVKLEDLSYNLYPVGITRRIEEYDAATDTFKGGKKYVAVGSSGLDNFFMVRKGFDWSGLVVHGGY